MKTLSHKQFSSLCRGATTLVKESFGDKVLRFPDESILKLFRIKHLISSARIYSHARRFARNAGRLSEKGIQTVSVHDVYNIPSISRSAVHYRPIEGVSLADHLKQMPVTPDLARQLAIFLARLHRKGVYFRAIHFGNIIILPDLSFGLIDVDDMRIARSALNRKKRLRNFHHFTKYENDRDHLRPQGRVFISAYLDACDSRLRNRRWFKDKLVRLLDL